jgi:metal-dependent amidase/aminoacylase/carboxypeptidase family protein
VITVGAIHGGSAENVISDHCDMKLDVRTFDASTRKRVLQSMRRIIDAESTASNAPKPPEMTATRNFPFLNNDEDVTKKLEGGFTEYFGDRYDANALRLGGSEDFGILATSIKRPSVFWTYGGVDHELWDKAEAEGKLIEDIPINHSPFFAPVIQPTLKVAVEAYVVSALTWLGKTPGER